MKANKTKERKTPLTKPEQVRFRLAWWHCAIALLVAAGAAFLVYDPALHGPFVFDDQYLPMTNPRLTESWQSWMSGVRPVLMLSYWFNYRLSELDTYSYHAGNVLFHAFNSLLVFLIVRRLLELCGSRPNGLAAFAGALFLLHPVQTEAVAYIAGRSDSLSTLFFLAAFSLFLYRRAPDVSWPVAAGILLLFTASIGIKENTVVLPALLLVTDLFWPAAPRDGRGSVPALAAIRGNWRIYAPIVLGGLAGAVFVLKRIGGGSSAGFGLKELTWYQYLFTQFRVVFSYLRLFVFPAGQTIDYDYPISATLLDHGAILGLLLLAMITGAAIYYRKRYPLAAYGWLIFLILLAPTSSIVPIKDPIAERRMYLPMLGLLLIVVEFLRRAPARKPALAAALACCLLVAGVLTYRRNHAWGGALALWRDTVEKSPNKGRAHFQLAYAYFENNQCQEALAEYQTVARLDKPDGRLLIDWALALNCLNRADEAIAKLKEAAALEPSAHVYSQIGMMYAKAGRRAEAEQAWQTAIQLDPNFDVTYVYLGQLYFQGNDPASAAREFRRALAINPANQLAQEYLRRAEAQLRSRR